MMTGCQFYDPVFHLNLKCLSHDGGELGDGLVAVKKIIVAFFVGIFGLRSFLLIVALLLGDPT
jgi:hypothetical protein